MGKVHLREPPPVLRPCLGPHVRSTLALYWQPETPTPIATRTSGTVTVVKLVGKLTADDGAAAFHDAIRTQFENRHRQIVLNCADASRIDDAGLAVFIETYKLARAQVGTVKIMVPTGIGWGGLTTTKVMTIFDVFGTEAEVIASLGGNKP